jgi:hypothetical protein
MLGAGGRVGGGVVKRREKEVTRRAEKEWSAKGKRKRKRKWKRLEGSTLVGWEYE